MQWSNPVAGGGLYRADHSCRTVPARCTNQLPVINIFHGIIIIIVCSVIIVMSTILLVVLIRKSIAKKTGSERNISHEFDQKEMDLQTFKRSDIIQASHQNYYISDHVLGQSVQRVPAPSVAGAPLLLINGVPFHIFHQVNRSVIKD